MIVVFDTSTLIYLLKPDTPAPCYAGTDRRIDDCQSRINFLLAELQKAKARIIVPTPVIAELLVHGGAASPEWLRILTNSRYFRPTPFDTLAAVECAEMSKVRLGAGRLSGAARAKAKFDDQIVAIARIERAEVIFSDDHDIRRLVSDDVQVRGIADLPLPPEERQGRLHLEQGPEDPGPPLDEE